MPYTSREELEDFFFGAIQYQWLEYMKNKYGEAWRYQWLRLEKNDDPEWTPTVNDYYIKYDNDERYHLRKWERDDFPVINSDGFHYWIRKVNSEGYVYYDMEWKEKGEDLWVPYGWAHADQRWALDNSIEKVTILESPGDYEELLNKVPTPDMKITMGLIAKAMADYYWDVVNEIDIALMPLYLYPDPSFSVFFKVSAINPKLESDIIPVIHPILQETGKALNLLRGGAWSAHNAWFKEFVGARSENGAPHNMTKTRFDVFEDIMNCMSGIGAGRGIGIWYDETDPNGFVKNPIGGVPKVEKAFHTFNEVFVKEDRPYQDGVRVRGSRDSTHEVVRSPLTKLFSGEIVGSEANYGENKEIFANFSYIETFYVSEVVSRRNGLAKGVQSDKFADFNVGVPSYVYAYIDEYNVSRARFISDKEELFLEFDDELPMEAGHQFNLMAGGETITEEKQLKKVYFKKKIVSSPTDPGDFVASKAVNENIADFEFTDNLVLALGDNLYKIHGMGANYVIIETEDEIELKKAAIFDYKAFSITGELSTPVGGDLSISLNRTNLYLDGTIAEFDNIGTEGSIDAYGYDHRSRTNEHAWLDSILDSNLAVLRHFIGTILKGEMRFSGDFNVLVDFDQIWGIHADHYLDLDIPEG
jgi:hypothetical protein